MRRILALVSFCFAAAALGLYALTFVQPPHTPLLFVFVFFNLAFGVLAIALGRNAHDPKMRLTFPRRFPRWVKPLGVIGGVFVALNFVLLFWGGTPIDRDGRFFRKTLSGAIQEISLSQYENLEASSQRSFSAFWLFFDVGLGLTLWFKESK